MEAELIISELNSKRSVAFRGFIELSKVNDVIKELVAKYNHLKETSITWGVDDFEGRARILEENASNVEIDWENPIMVNEYCLYDRNKFNTALLKMISQHDSCNGITWQTIDEYLESDCKIQVIKIL